LFAFHRLNARPAGRRNWNKVNCFVRTRLTVRAKRALVNSVFLVQLRKKAGEGLAGLHASGSVEKRVSVAMNGAVFG
jgi:hypothetical protein